MLAFGSASIPSFDAFAFLGYFVRVSFRSRISNEWISGMVPHPPLRPLCVPRLLSLSTMIFPSNRSEDSSFGLSRNSRTREKDKNKASRGPRSRVKVTSQVAFSGLAVHSAHFWTLCSRLVLFGPVYSVWYHIARKIGSTSHRLWAGKSIYLESAIPDSERNLDPKTSCGLDSFILSGLTLIVILTLLWDLPLSQ